LFGEARTPEPAAATHGDRVAELCRAVLTAAGATDPDTRASAFDGIGVPDPWRDYVAKVRESSYRITDADIENLVAGGCTEDAIFEMTLAAAVGAASERLDAGLRALRGSG
jgi:hypothetical protein